MYNNGKQLFKVFYNRNKSYKKKLKQRFSIISQFKMTDLSNWNTIYLKHNQIYTASLNGSNHCPKSLYNELYRNQVSSYFLSTSNSHYNSFYSKTPKIPELAEKNSEVVTSEVFLTSFIRQTFKQVTYSINNIFTNNRAKRRYIKTASRTGNTNNYRLKQSLLSFPSTIDKTHFPQLLCQGCTYTVTKHPHKQLSFHNFAQCYQQLNFCLQLQTKSGITHNSFRKINIHEPF